MQEADRDLVQALADELGIAFHRAQLYEDAQRLALRDPLTGLYNHRALQQMVQRHADESLADRLPLSVIMVDVDHFRQFNEHAGHDAGDLALHIVAQAIQGAIRSQDIAARYGGEEFTVILPKTRSEHAATVAERIRAAIASSWVPIQASGERLTITASLGVATLPLDASTPAALLKSADLALYAAKRQGRNQVSVYTTLRHDEALAS